MGFFFFFFFAHAFSREAESRWGGGGASSFSCDSILRRSLFSDRKSEPASVNGIGNAESAGSPRVRRVISGNEGRPYVLGALSPPTNPSLKSTGMLSRYSPATRPPPRTVNNSSAGLLGALLWMLCKNTSQPATFTSRRAAKKKNKNAEVITYPLVVNVSQHPGNQLNGEDQQEAEEILGMTQRMQTAVNHLICPSNRWLFNTSAQEEIISTGS